LLQVSNDCVDAAADVLAVVLCLQVVPLFSCMLLPLSASAGNFSHC